MDGGIAGIGRTPIVRLGKLDDDCAEVWVKLEAANPTGSYKDRMAVQVDSGLKHLAGDLYGAV